MTTKLEEELIDEIDRLRLRLKSVGTLARVAYRFGGDVGNNGMYKVIALMVDELAPEKEEDRC